MDEVNLLDDHLVDVLLDSAASGWNTVEREGISISHPARFILSRIWKSRRRRITTTTFRSFWYACTNWNCKRTESYVFKLWNNEQVLMQLQLNFVKLIKNHNNNLQIKLLKLVNFLPEVQIDYDFRVKISQICSELDVDGLRGDLVTNRASKAISCF